MSYCRFLTAFSVAVLMAAPLRAQSFGPAETPGKPVIQNVRLPSAAAPRQAEKQVAPAVKKFPAVKKSSDAAAVTKDGQPNPAEKLPAEEDIFLPRDTPLILFTKTKDGSKRGYVSMMQVNDDGSPVKSSSQIFLYYANFRIDRSINGKPSCDARFFVNTNLDSRIISLDVKLVWPGLTTTLSFANVPPNTPTYYDYTLLGDGCYNMDKMPNIVVNRCRVKGMNSAECASKITWLQPVRKNN